MNILIIGGTRQVGHYLTEHLLESGHRVTLLNRGLTRDSLPESLPRLHCDRNDSVQLRRALSGRNFDVVVDTVLYRRPEAETIVSLLDGRVGHYIALSSGQVYLVRDGLKRPFREDDYAGSTILPPTLGTYDYEEWLYGIDKRACEDILIEANLTKHFPSTILRLPMVHSARDQFLRLYSYVLRLRDGGPILVPDLPNHPIRHIYALDVVKALVNLIESGKGKGRAYNISQDETLPISEFLGKLGEAVGVQPQIVTIPRERLVADGFLPDCSPFSDVWMSELDNTRSKTELGMTYTPVSDYLSKIVEELTELRPNPPAGYRRRNGERTLANRANDGE